MADVDTTGLSFGASFSGAPKGAPIAEEPGALLGRLEAHWNAGGRVLTPVDAAALDALAAGCARGGGACEVALGEGLDLLARTGGDIRLGYSSVGDLARERLGINPSQARRLRRNAIALRSRPLLREAVVRGDVTARKAEAVVLAAVGEQEEYWVSRARVESVRRLEALVRTPEHAEDDWHRIRLSLPRAHAAVVEVALEMAKLVQGPTTPIWNQLWALAAEFLSEYPIDPLVPRWSRPTMSGGGGPQGAHGALGAAIDGGPAGPAAAPPPAHAPEPGFAAGTEPGPAPGTEQHPDPYAILESLIRLVAERATAEEHLGRACLLVKRFGVATRLGYSCFAEYCVERLGLARSTVYQRLALERRMASLPALREALRAGRLSYEQARLVARVATPGDVARRIAEAAGKTCIALSREVEAEERVQMWNAAEVRAVVPEEVDVLLAEALHSAKIHSPFALTPGQAFVVVALHFIETWGPEVKRLVRGADPVILRDGGLCQVPGCSRAADHVHHTWFRSAGGPARPWNEISMCLVHHLLGVHAGNLWIAGRAPDALTFVLGEREAAAARRRYATATPSR